MRPRLGHIQFLNCFPLYYGLVNRNVLIDVELVKGTPTQLNQLLLDRNLDISVISSIEYARNSEDLLLLPDFTVSCDGEVQSIILASKVPIEDLGPSTIALTNTSATSQILLKLILKQGYGLEPRFFECPPELSQMLFEADAALLIGDPALKVRYFPPDNLFLYDLGAEWKKLTGKMMVFAVWCVSKEYYVRNPGPVRMVYEGIRESMKYSNEHLDEVSLNAARWEQFSPGQLKEYFRTLKFGFDERQKEGLREFYRYAHMNGFLGKEPELRFI